MSQGELSEAALYNFTGKRLCQESNSEEANQLFKMANTDPNPFVHLSFEPNGLAQVHSQTYH